MAKQPRTETRTETSRHPTAATGRAGADALVSLLLRLQSSLDPEVLVDILASELDRLVAFSQLRYRDPDGALITQIGRAGRSQVAYRLVGDDGEALGEIRIARRRVFEEHEHRVIEQALGLFQYPLRNALAHHRLAQQVRCDSVTGLFNRTAFEEDMERELALARRHGEPLALLVLDVNDFKRVNDDHGHRTGDAMLRHIATLIRDTARDSDLVFRYGGDEFVVLVRHADEDGAVRMGRRLTRALLERPLVHEGRVIPATLSIGIATPGTADTARSVFDRADASMYAAKRGATWIRTQASGAAGA